MDTYTFYATFGSGQPGFPGYLRVSVKADCIEDAELIARRRIVEATDNRWCGLYYSLEALHPMDRIYRGDA